MAAESGVAGWREGRRAEDMVWSVNTCVAKYKGLIEAQNKRPEAVFFRHTGIE